MIRRIMRRMRAGRAPLGAWTPSLVLALGISGAAVFCAIIPADPGSEHYWLAWLGARVLDGHGIPHALGPESPLDVGRPWIAQQWLTGVIIEAARRSGTFLALAIAMALSWSLLAWLALGECIRRRVDPGLTFLVVLQAGIVCTVRFAIRGESLTIALLAATYLAARDGSQRRCWLLLPPLLALWANLHASFFLGFAACGYAFVQRRAWWGLGPWTTAIAATLINPFGVHLWEYALWLPQSWVPQYSSEWLAMWQYKPSFMPGLLLPLIAIAGRAAWRRNALGGLLVWIATSAAALHMLRLAIVPAAFGIPAGAGTVRARARGGLAIGTPGLALALAAVLAIATHDTWIGAGRPRLDPDFGLVVPDDSPQARLGAAPLRGRLTYCITSTDCSIVLFHGGLTILDGRDDPFPEERLRRLKSGPHGFEAYPVQAIVAAGTIRNGILGPGWRMERYGGRTVYFKTPIAEHR